jgi:hypothetical protein
MIGWQWQLFLPAAMSSGSRLTLVGTEGGTKAQYACLDTGFLAEGFLAEGCFLNAGFFLDAGFFLAEGFLADSVLEERRAITGPPRTRSVCAHGFASTRASAARG